MGLSVHNLSFLVIEIAFITTSFNFHSQQLANLKEPRIPKDLIDLTTAFLLTISLILRLTAQPQRVKLPWVLRLSYGRVQYMVYIDVRYYSITYHQLKRYKVGYIKCSMYLRRVNHILTSRCVRSKLSMSTN